MVTVGGAVYQPARPGVPPDTTMLESGGAASTRIVALVWWASTLPATSVDQYSTVCVPLASGVRLVMSKIVSPPPSSLKWVWLRPEPPSLSRPESTTNGRVVNHWLPLTVTSG